MPTSEPQQTPPSSEQSETQPPQTLVDLITGVLSILLLSSLTIRSFVGRWQRLKPLSDQCTLSSFAGGKLLMQSDLDMASSSLSSHLHDLDLLLRSGVLHQSNAIVLSQPGPGSDKDDLVFFIRDLFTRLQIGGIEFKRKALESVLQLLDKDEKSTAVVAKEGNFGYLISSIPLKEKAAIAVEAITTDPENAWAISAYGGVSVLIEVCRSGSQPTQIHEVGALRNLSSVEDIRIGLGEEGAVPVILQLLVSGSTAAQEKAANFLSILASSDAAVQAIVSLLTVRSNRKKLVRDEKSVMRLVQMLDPKNEAVSKKYPLMVVTAVLGGEAMVVAKDLWLPEPLNIFRV
ncbi:zinc finger family protein [Hibiscus syriacus]|uniref:Zinc finger family protein n=1 Tax=Hibiscus syriacus TaxID=106335 RepID=A0A6A2ZGJ2_HIBSY|nr:zinc finger family protein [Hibiscus syriacus]